MISESESVSLKQTEVGGVDRQVSYRVNATEVHEKEPTGHIHDSADEP